MSRFLISVALFVACLLRPAWAEQVNVHLNYSTDDPQMTVKDKACVSALRDHILREFDGLTDVSLPSMPIMNFPDMPIAIYPGVEFTGRHGNAKAALVCEFHPGSAKVQMISVAFEGRGLAGFMKSPFYYLDPTKGRAIAFSAAPHG